ncbi:ATPase [Pseudonocardiaceae bacterium YIM PH 21723]|nr:ATPase [Pseudonocardiaceae bacterium YIM PH 21723]
MSGDATASRLIALTGGPGSGKTTVIELLRAAGYATAPEAGRAIIRQQQAIGGSALPWADRSLFAELMLAWELRSHQWALDQPGPVFFDHAVPSVAGYLRLCELPVPSHVDSAARLFRYHPTVFVAPPWPDIYRTDTERQQSADEAVATHDALVATYRHYGYRLVELPRTSPQNRLDFLLSVTG